MERIEPTNNAWDGAPRSRRDRRRTARDHIGRSCSTQRGRPGPRTGHPLKTPPRTPTSVTRRRRYGPGGRLHGPAPPQARQPRAHSIRDLNEPLPPQCSNKHIETARLTPNLFSRGHRRGAPQLAGEVPSSPPTTQIQTYTAAVWCRTRCSSVPTWATTSTRIAVHPLQQDFSPDTALGSPAPDKFLRLTQVHDHRGPRRRQAGWIREVGWSNAPADTPNASRRASRPLHRHDVSRCPHQPRSYVKAVLGHMGNLDNDQSNSEMFS